jgi:hypothetical protein
MDTENLDINVLDDLFNAGLKGVDAFLCQWKGCDSQKIIPLCLMGTCLNNDHRVFSTSEERGVTLLSMMASFFDKQSPYAQVPAVTEEAYSQLADIACAIMRHPSFNLFSIEPSYAYVFLQPLLSPEVIAEKALRRIMRSCLTYTPMDRIDDVKKGCIRLLPKLRWNEARNLLETLPSSEEETLLTKLFISTQKSVTAFLEEWRKHDPKTLLSLCKKYFFMNGKKAVLYLPADEKVTVLHRIAVFFIKEEECSKKPITEEEYKSLADIACKIMGDDFKPNGTEGEDSPAYLEILFKAFMSCKASEEEYMMLIFRKCLSFMPDDAREGMKSLIKDVIALRREMYGVPGNVYFRKILVASLLLSLLAAFIFSLGGWVTACVVFYSIVLLVFLRILWLKKKRMSEEEQLNFLFDGEKASGRNTPDHDANRRLNFRQDRSFSEVPSQTRKKVEEALRAARQKYGKQEDPPLRLK